MINAHLLPTVVFVASFLFLYFAVRLGVHRDAGLHQERGRPPGTAFLSRYTRKGGNRLRKPSAFTWYSASALASPASRCSPRLSYRTPGGAPPSTACDETTICPPCATDAIRATVCTEMPT